MSNIIFCGPPCCGKTTVGKRLATLLQRDFIDTDTLIENVFYERTQQALTCKDIYKMRGNAFFRALEKEVVAKLKEKERCVIATGGGAVLDPQNVFVLRSLGKIIYLLATQHTLMERMKQRGFPAHLGETHKEEKFFVMMQERQLIYENLAECVFHVENKDVDDIVSEILRNRSLCGE